MRRASRIVRHDDEREREAFARVVERLAWMLLGACLAHMMDRLWGVLA